MCIFLVHCFYVRFSLAQAAHEAGAQAANLRAATPSQYGDSILERSSE